MQKPKVPTTEMSSILNQHRLSTSIKFAAITIAIVVLYFQDLSMVFTGALTDQSTFQILAIPFLFAYLLFRKRKIINASIQPAQISVRGFQKHFSTLTGIALSAVAIMTYWYGSYTFTPLEYHLLTLPLLVAGLTLILFNLQTLKQLLVPIAFLIFLTPPPDQILFSLGSALANLCASTSNTLANIFGLHATFSESNVGPVITLIRPDHTTLPFNVDVACSGVYSLIGFVIFALLIAYIMRGKLRNKFAILLMGIPLIVALNIIRITIILAIGYNFGENLALELFHDVGATVLMFVGVLLLLWITDKVFKKPRPPQPCTICNISPLNTTELFCPNCGNLFKFPKTKLNRVDLTKIAGIAIFVVILLSIQAPVFALTQGPAQVIIQTPSGTEVNTSSSLLPNVPGYTLSYVYSDTAFQQLSGDNAALVYSYTSTSKSNQTVWAAVQIASSVTSEHQWQECLIIYPLSQGDQSTVNQLDNREIQIQNNPPITAQYFAFQYKETNQTQVVLYWYETVNFNANGTAQTKSVMVSLITYPSSAQGVSEDENQELPFADAITGYWTPIETWSAIALSISQNGLELSSGAFTILVILILYASFINRKEKRALLSLYKKLLLQDQLLMKAVTNAEKMKNPSTRGVTLEFQKLVQSPISETWITQRLNAAENAGLIKKILVNKDDNPALAWKNQIPEKTSFFGRLNV